MDDLLRQAYERRDRLRRELETVDGFIASYEKLSVPPHPGTRPNYEFDLESPTPARGRRVRTPDLARLYEAAQAAILQAGKPLLRSELLHALEQQGFSFPGTDKVKVFGTNLWRSKRFISLKGLGYWPKAHLLPPAYRHAEQRSSMLEE